MNEEMKPTGLLEAAARLIERALIQMDVSETPCTACGGRRFNNRTEARVYEQLSNMPTTLRNGVERLKGTYQSPKLTPQQARRQHESRRAR